MRASVGAFDTVLEEDRRDVIKALIAMLDGSTTRRQEIVLNAADHVRTGPRVTRHLADERVARLAAWRRYSGVVWSHLGPASLEPAQRRRILVPSSLYGITTAEDRIADFRLKMNVGVTPLGTMSTFWRPKVTPALAAHAQRSTIVNLLPSSTRRPSTWGSSRARVASCGCNFLMAKAVPPLVTTRKR